jgi:hypothetical protein
LKSIRQITKVIQVLDSSLIIETNLGQHNCHENGESAHEKSKTYEHLAIFMLRGAPEAHDACRKISHQELLPGTLG